MVNFDTSLNRPKGAILKIHWILSKSRYPDTHSFMDDFDFFSVIALPFYFVYIPSLS